MPTQKSKIPKTRFPVKNTNKVILKQYFYRNVDSSFKGYYYIGAT